LGKTWRFGNKVEFASQGFVFPEFKMRERPSHHHRASSYYNQGLAPSQSSGPSHGKRHSQNQHVSAGANITDYFKRNFLLDQPFFAKITANNEEKYEDYVRRHQRVYFERFFETHKRDAWLTENQTKQENVLLDESSPISMEYKEDVYGKYDPNTFLLELSPNSLPDSLKDLVTEENALVLSNIPPYMSFAELTDLIVLEKFPFTNVSLSLPDPTKQFYRYAWLSYVHENLEEVKNALEEKFAQQTNQTRLYVSLNTNRYVRKARVSLLSDSDIETIKEVSSSKDLDLLLLEERTKYNLCILCGVQASCPQELIQRCGHYHFYTRAQSESSATETLKFQSELCKLVKEIDSFIPLRDPSVMLDVHFIRKLDEAKFQCRHCEKLFKGSEFVTKHYLGKHPEEADRIKSEFEIFNDLRTNKRLAFVVWPPAMLVAPVPKALPHQPTPHFQPQRDDSRRPKSFQQNNPHGGRPPVKREYKDWDAIKSKDEPINY
jgi:hypothetical protein